MRGRQLPKWVCKPIILQIFAENCMKMKESGLPTAPYLDPPNIFMHISAFKQIVVWHPTSSVPFSGKILNPPLTT